MTSEDQIRCEIVGAAATVRPAAKPPATPEPPQPPPRPMAPGFLFILGALMLLLSLGALAWGNPGQAIGGMLGLLVAVVMIVGGLLLGAIAELRVDLWEHWRERRP